MGAEEDGMSDREETALVDAIWENDIFLAVLNVPCHLPFAWETIVGYGERFNMLILSNRAARRAYVAGQRRTEFEP
jgi:hypothetical protein